MPLYMGTKYPAKATLSPFTLAKPPSESLVGHSHKPPPGPQNRSRSVTLRGWRSRPLFHNLFENHTASPESEVWQLVGASSPAPWNKLYRGGWEVWFPYSWNTLSLLKNGNDHPGLRLHRCCPRPLCDIEEACQSRQSHNVHIFQHIIVNIFHPCCLPPGSCWTTLVSTSTKLPLANSLSCSGFYLYTNSIFF